MSGQEKLISKNWEAALSRIVEAYDYPALLTSSGGAERGLRAKATEVLGSKRVTVLPPAPRNPSVSDVLDLYRQTRPLDVDAIVAIGGGSVIDTAKALAVACSVHSVEELNALLVDGGSWREELTPHLIAVPTTAGSGSESTPFATIWDNERFGKKSLSGRSLLPKAAILDATLLTTLEGEALLFPALDAVSHAVESLWSKRQTHESRWDAALSLESLRGTVLSCVTSKPDLEALSRGSTLAGSAIAVSRTAIAHSISYPLSMRFGIPHGLACSFTLPAIHSVILEKIGVYYSEIWLVEEVLADLSILNLGNRVLEYADFRGIMESIPFMLTPGRGDNCILDLTSDDIQQVLESSLAACL